MVDATMSEILTARLADLKECIDNIREDWKRPSDVSFEQDRAKRQLVILNLQLAFQNLQDMANHLVRVRKLGWPKYSAENFELLEKTGLITAEMSAALQAGTGMRNIMVHQYKKIDLNLVEKVVEEHLDNLLQYGDTLSRLAPETLADDTDGSD